MTAAWDRDEALRMAERMENLHPYVGTGDAAALLRAADAEITRLRARDEAAEKMAEALRLTRRSHGVLLLTDPPQDPWKANRVDEMIVAALAAWDAIREEAQ